MELTLHKRSAKTNGENTKIRLEGGIPCIMYGRDMPSEPVYALKTEVANLLRKVKKGHLSTVVLTLKSGKETFKALVKDIQYNLTSYEVQHIDFLKVADKEIVVKVPLEVQGMEECVGINMGGFFRGVIRSVKVKCLPQNIPHEFVINIKDLNIMQSKKITDLTIPPQVKILHDPKQVMVIIAKTKG